MAQPSVAHAGSGKGDDGAVIYWTPIFAKAQILESKEIPIRWRQGPHQASGAHGVKRGAMVGWVDQCDLKLRSSTFPFWWTWTTKKLKPGYKMLLESPLCLDKSCGASSPLAQPRCLRPGSLLTIKQVLPEKESDYSKVVPYVVSTCRGDMVLDSEKLPTYEVFIPVPER
jgi:hypothetical protein